MTVAEALPGAPITAGQSAFRPSIAAARPADGREIERLLRSLVRNLGEILQFAAVATDCRADIPLSRTLVLSMEERLAAGDVRAIRDAVAELPDFLDQWLGDYDAAVGHDHETAKRLHEVTAAKRARGELKWNPQTGDGGDGSQPEGAAEDSPQRKDGTRRTRRACGQR
jgi:hypothetical protein